MMAARVALAAAATEQDPFYEILEHWPGHFRGNFCVTAPQELYGWKLRLKFEAPISQMQISRMRVLGHNVDKTIWRLADEGHNAVWREGERRCWSFIATRQGLTSGLQAEVMFIQLPEVQDCPDQVQGQRFTLEITSYWRNGLSGRFCLRVPRDLQDWKIRVEFGADAKGITGLQVPEAGRVTNVERRMTWLLTPRNYNRVLSEGQTFCLAFTRTSRGWVRPCVRAFFTESDGETPIEVTLPPTTTAPETTQPPETTQGSSSAGTTEASTPAPTTHLPETTQPPETTQRSSTEAPTTTEPMSTPEYGSVYTELQLWEEGVNGMLCLYHAVPITCGWEAEIVFDPAVDSIEIWRAGVAGLSPYTGSSNVVHLTNLTFNSEVAENPVCLDFNAFKSYPEAPASVYGQFTRICSNDQWVDIPGGTELTPAPPEMTTEPSTDGDATTASGVTA